MQPTSLCNMNCRYCYVPNRLDSTVMSHETLACALGFVLHSRLVRKEIELLWHAGEPLTAGIDFYRNALDLVAKINTRKIKVDHTIQTNGTLVNARWAQFLAEHCFGVGLSVDGPKFLHDRNRLTWGGKPTHEATMRAACMLREHGIKVGALCVLTLEHLSHPDEVFDFFVQSGFPWVGFNVEEIENANLHSSLKRGASRVSSTTVMRYRTFLDRVFRRWREDPKRIEVREFSDFLGLARRKKRNAAHRRIPDETRRVGIITIQKDGDVTPFSPEFAGAKASAYRNFVIGNVHSHTLEQCFGSGAFQSIYEDVYEGVRMCAKTCKYFDFCGGAFTSNKFFENGSIRSTETTTCILHRQTLTEVILDNLLAA